MRKSPTLLQAVLELLFLVVFLAGGTLFLVSKIDKTVTKPKAKPTAEFVIEQDGVKIYKVYSDGWYLYFTNKGGITR